MHELLHQLVRRFNLEAAQARQLWQMSQLHARPPALRGWLEGDRKSTRLNSSHW